MTVDALPAECTTSTCRACDGNGEVLGDQDAYTGGWDGKTCPDCGGTGQAADRCSHCAEPTPADELVDLGGQEVCQPCLGTLTGDDVYAPDNARDL